MWIQFCCFLHPRELGILNNRIHSMITLNPIRIRDLLFVFFRVKNLLNLIMEIEIWDVFCFLNDDFSRNILTSLVNKLHKVLCNKENHRCLEFQEDVKPLEIFLPGSPIHDLPLDVKESRDNSCFIHDTSSNTFNREVARLMYV